MDKMVLKQLRQFASVLPDVMQDTFAIVSGDEILKHNSNAVDGSGKGIIADGRYKVRAKMKVNHYRNLKKVYKAKGIDGVMEYAGMMKEFKVGNAKMVNEVVGGVFGREDEVTRGF